MVRDGHERPVGVDGALFPRVEEVADVPPFVENNELGIGTQTKTYDAIWCGCAWVAAPGGEAEEGFCWWDLVDVAEKWQGRWSFGKPIPTGFDNYLAKQMDNESNCCEEGDGRKWDCHGQSHMAESLSSLADQISGLYGLWLLFSRFRRKS